MYMRLIKTITYLDHTTVHKKDLLFDCRFGFFYGGTEAPYHGSKGGSYSLVILDDDEYITSVIGTYGTFSYVNSIGFVTNKLTHGPYGRLKYYNKTNFKVSLLMSKIFKKCY